MFCGVDYDEAAPAYDQRYDRHAYEGVEAVLREFVATGSNVLEVGCGTGHWLRAVRGRAGCVVGLDLSSGMLRRARAADAAARLLQGTAHRLPMLGRAFDRVICINALHHFPDRAGFLREARRVLRPGGGLMIVGLDPHVGVDQWWVYDFFPSALPADLLRYPSAKEIQRELSEAGFGRVVTLVAQHMSGAVAYEQALETGLLDRQSTSQLMVIPESEYLSGVARIEAERALLTADLRLYATFGWS